MTEHGIWEMEKASLIIIKKSTMHLNQEKVTHAFITSNKAVFRSPEWFLQVMHATGNKIFRYAFSGMRINKVVPVRYIRAGKSDFSEHLNA